MLVDANSNYIYTVKYICYQSYYHTNNTFVIKSKNKAKTKQPSDQKDVSKRAFSLANGRKSNANWLKERESWFSHLPEKYGGDWQACAHPCTHSSDFSLTLSHILSLSFALLYSFLFSLFCSLCSCIFSRSPPSFPLWIVDGFSFPRAHIL